MSEFASNPIIAGLSEIRRSWAWFLTLGILFMVFGVICIISGVTATFGTVLFFGWLLLFSGVVALAHAFWDANLERLLLPAQCTSSRIHGLPAHRLFRCRGRRPDTGARLILRSGWPLPRHCCGNGAVASLGMSSVLGHRLCGALCR